MKVRLKKILYDNIDYTQLFNAINSTNNVTHIGFLFIRSFILHVIENNNTAGKPKIVEPSIDIEFIRCVFSVICSTQKPKRGRRFNEDKDTQIRDLLNYWNIFKIQTNMETISSETLSYVLGQMYDQFYHSIINNIHYHFDKHLWAFIKANFKDEYLLLQKQFSKKVLKNYYSELNKIKNDLLNKTETSDIKYHQWIKLNIENIVPTTYVETSFESDIKKNTFKYLKCMCFINKYLQDKDIKSYQIFPVRTACYQKHIKINSSALIDIFHGHSLLNKGTKIEYLQKAGNPKLQEYLWNKIFKLKNIDGKYNYEYKGYSFNYEIETDGFSVSLNFINNDEIPNKEKRKENFKIGREKTNLLKSSMSPEDFKLFQQNKKVNTYKKSDADKLLQKQKNKEMKELFKNKSKEEQEQIKIMLNNSKEFPYIEHILKNDEIREEFMDYYINGKIILCDPGMKSILTLMSSNNEIHIKRKKLKTNNFGVSIWNKHKIFSYTSKTRAKFLKGKHYSDLIESWKNKSKYNKTLKDIEKELSLFNAKSCTNNDFIDYIKKKVEYNKKALDEYDTKYVRKLKWFSYLNKNKHENDLLNHIQNEYGDDIIIIMGDWSGSGKHIKHKTVPNIALKRKLSERFKVYLIDEYLTSKIHYKHHIRCKNLKIPNKIKSEIQPVKKFSSKLHSVLTYKIVKDEVNDKIMEMGCINRDKNAVLNMEAIVKSLITTGNRPEIFSRTYNPADPSGTGSNCCDTKGANRETIKKTNKTQANKEKSSKNQTIKNKKSKTTNKISQSKKKSKIKSEQPCLQKDNNIKKSKSSNKTKVI